MYNKSQILKEIFKFVAPVMNFHFCQKYECLGAKHVVLHRPSVHFGLGTVSKVPCGNALLPSGHNVTCHTIPPQYPSQKNILDY